MIELIRQSAVPPNLMRAAARGALSLPLPEMVEVLVYLTTLPLFSAQAQLTLAGWDEATLGPALSDPAAPAEVLAYFLAPANLRAPLLPALLGNPAITAEQMAELALAAPASLLPLLGTSARVRSAEPALRALLRRPDLPPGLAGQLDAALAQFAPDAATALANDAPLDLLDPDLLAYLEAHAEEVAAAGNEPFQLIGPSPDEQAELALARRDSPVSLAARALGGHQRVSTIQRISKLTVGERILLALKGSREERAILVRDGVKVVANAVLHSPRLTEQEVDLFASLRNVGENVLRNLASSRRFMRRYVVKRLLTANPRCPIDVALPLIKELLAGDLENLTRNRNISETVRRFAWRTLQARQEHP
jgi:hypothetical protein